MDVKTTQTSERKNNTTKSSYKNMKGDLAETILKEHKERIGEVVHIVINGRTTIEFPASMSIEERNVRIERYKKQYKLKE